MKIAVVVPGGLHPSGIEQVVPSWLALFERLAESHDIHAFALKHLPEPQTYTLRRFTVHDLGRPSAPAGLTRWAQERALTRALDREGPFDLIHGFHADPCGQLAARAARRLNAPSIVTCDSGEFVSMAGIDYGSQRTAPGRRAVSEACTQATVVHVCTNFMAGLAGAHGFAATVIPLTSVDAGTAAIDRQIRSAGGPLRLIQIASLSRVKNQRLLIDALRVVRTTVDAHLELDGEDTLSGELQQHAAAIGMTPHVTFHGFLPQDAIIDMLRHADLYVQSSVHEAAGVAVLEAAAAGVPAIGTAAGYVADWSSAGAAAIVDATPQSLAEGIMKLHADPERRRSIAAQARAFSLAHDAAAAAAAFDRLYRSLAR